MREDATIGFFPDGRRLGCRHGPIDLVIEAFGPEAAVRAAHARASARFPGILPELCAELALLRSRCRADERAVAEQKPLPLVGRGRGGALGSYCDIDTARASFGTTPSLARPHKGGGDARDRHAESESVGPLAGEGLPCGPVARRMHAAVLPFSAEFITPMAAVAGAVAEEMLFAMLARPMTLTRAYVNNGGDIALHLAPGAAFTIGLVSDPRDGRLVGTIEITAASPVRGIATSGRHGRSFSLGIADAVTVLARNAAEADAAATMIANAVDLPGSPLIRRAPANSLQPDSDLGARLVTVDVAPLSADEVDAALAAGLAVAEAHRRAGLIHSACLVLQGRHGIAGPLALAASREAA